LGLEEVQIMRVAAALLVIVLAGTSAFATECAEIDSSTMLEEGHRAYTLLQGLQTKSPEITLCVFGTLDSVSTAKACCYPYERPVIVMSRYTLEKFSDEELLGALAHELGHILRKSPYLSNGRKVELEEEATDAIAIQMAGEKALEAAYIAHTGDKALAKRRVKRAMKILRADAP
jgi:hypothetical protein